MKGVKGILLLVVDYLESYIKIIEKIFFSILLYNLLFKKKIRIAILKIFLQKK